MACSVTIEINGFYVPILKLELTFLFQTNISTKCLVELMALVIVTC